MFRVYAPHNMHINRWVHSRHVWILESNRMLSLVSRWRLSWIIDSSVEIESLLNREISRRDAQFIARLSNSKSKKCPALSRLHRARLHSGRFCMGCWVYIVLCCWCWCCCCPAAVCNDATVLHLLVRLLQMRRTVDAPNYDFSVSIIVDKNAITSR